MTFSGGFSNARIENVLESELELLLKAELMWLLCVCTFCRSSTGSTETMYMTQFWSLV
jgi:hypothetical protein